jgi:hypothetical protein
LLVVRHAFEEDNEFLADRLSALRGELSQTGGLGSLTATLRNPRASKVEAYSVRVIDSKGDIVTETPKMSGFLPPAVFPILRIRIRFTGQGIIEPARSYFRWSPHLKRPMVTPTSSNSLKTGRATRSLPRNLLPSLEAS